MKKYLIALVVIIALALIAWRSGKIKEIINPLVTPSATSTPIVTPGDTGNQPVACTMEAKQCPDGSYVGRTGPKCEFTACPVAKSSDTTGWQTYKNEQLGYEINYPKGWYLYEVAGQNIKGFWPKKYEGEGLGVWVDVKPNSNNLSATQWWFEDIKQYGDGEDLKNNSTISNVVLNGISGIEIKTTPNYNGRQSEHLIFSVKGIVYIINTNVLDDSVFEKIIASFKLI
ncbi:MAG: hypothetical protein NTY66_04220 [Candidatus Vogelbacteria bacterium]|nr:hypothetical protein [Candidatus Vogelbacteria bacterium]